VDLLVGYWLWIKALHVVAVISWMAGLLYLPRLFVYHTETEPGSESSERFKVMERRLLRLIMNPAMVAAWLFGILLLLVPGLVDWSAGWIWVKLASVAALTVLHHLFALWRKDFAADRARRPARVYRIANEGPTLAMIVVVIMVIVKPF
jgi:protoporphyrinogen IX oxidase